MKLKSVLGGLHHGIRSAGCRSLIEFLRTTGVTLFTSPPGGGKTTLLRAFTPTALRAFWNARLAPEMSESCQRLLSHGVLHETDGAQLLGVSLSCASGYADLPPGASMAQDGVFRALFDCRVVKALRSLAALLGRPSTDQLEDVRLQYEALGADPKSIAALESIAELAKWAEQREQAAYEQLDLLIGVGAIDLPLHVRFESILSLQAVRFNRNGEMLAPRRLLMLDDVQRLRKRQRALLLEEMVELRPTVPVWVAQRSIALGNELLSQGAREGRDLRDVVNYATPDSKDM